MEKKLVLVVEPDLVVSSQIAAYLSSQGWDVVVEHLFEGGMHAFRARKGEIAFVVCAERLGDDPEEQGVDFFNMRSLDLCVASIPFVLLVETASLGFFAAVKDFGMIPVRKGPRVLDDTRRALMHLVFWPCVRPPPSSER